MRRASGLSAVILKEIQQTIRDKRVLAILIIVPVFQLVVLGFAVNLDVHDVPVVVADEDRSQESRDYVDGALAGDTFERVQNVASAAEAIERVTRGEAAVALVVPRGFGDDLARGTPARVQWLTDGSDSNRAIVAQNAATAYTRGLAWARSQTRLAQAAASRGAALQLPTARVEPRIFYNPTLNSTFYFVPGIAATLLLIVAIVVTAMGLAREKEMGTLEQVLVTPIQPLTLIAGKTIPYAVVGLADLGLVLASGMLMFDVPMRGSILVLFVGGALYLLSVLGIGLLVSTVARNQQQAFMVAIFLVMPAILLSGFLTPIGNMPEVLQPVTTINPVRHFVELLRAVMLKGAGWSDVLPQLTALAGIGLTIFGMATVSMSRRLK